MPTVSRHCYLHPSQCRVHYGMNTQQMLAQAQMQAQIGTAFLMRLQSGTSLDPEGDMRAAQFATQLGTIFTVGASLSERLDRLFSRSNNVGVN